MESPPLLLVPGWSDRGRALEPCRRYFIAAGWPAGHVRCLDFRDRFGSNVEHATEIAAAVDGLRRDTGCARVSVVAHSMGGLALRYHLVSVPEPGVETAVFAGTPHYGTWAAYVAWGAGAPEMRPGSSFLQSLNERPIPEQVRAHCIRTPIDTRVLPGASARLEGAAYHVVRYPRHDGMLRHRPTLDLVRRLVANTG